jgi:3-oxoacyl-[acyl-carrier-protein] synthase-1
MTMTAVISATSVVCAAGFGADQVWATTRSRVSRISNSSVMDRHLEPIPMGLVPETALDADGPEPNPLGWPSRVRRMLRLAAPALRELAEEAGDVPVALYLGLPQPLSNDEPSWRDDFSTQLCARAGLKLDDAASRTFAAGRAAFLIALESALEALGADPARPILVGAVDTFLDLSLLATLSAEGRVLGPQVMDGFIPGEGAAFLLLGAADQPAPGALVIRGAASSLDPGHRYGTEPARGEGLAQALEVLRERASAPLTPIGSTFAGFNGENFDAKLWGVAQLRHKDFFDPAMTLEHPASCFGDTGAATGAILTVLAATALAAQHRQGPALVWAASDHAERGCAIVANTAPA